MSKFEALIAWLSVSVGALAAAYCFRDSMGQAIDNCYWIGGGVLAAWLWMHARRRRDS